jgi:hypothetical protein
VRAPIVALAALLIASAALADEPVTTTQTDYSRNALLHFVANNEIRMSPLPAHLPPARHIRWHLGWMEFHALGMDWRIFYLPIAIPMAGTALHDIAKVPNALDLTGTPFATGPQLFPDRSASVNREVKRALKFERQAKVKVEH